MIPKLISIEALPAGTQLRDDDLIPMRNATKIAMNADPNKYLDNIRNITDENLVMLLTIQSNINRVNTSPIQNSINSQVVKGPFDVQFGDRFNPTRGGGDAGTSN